MTASASIVDTHCHLDYVARREDLEDRDPAQVFERARLEGVEFVVNPTVAPSNYDQVKAVAESLKNVYMAVAIHPTDVHETREYPDWKERVNQMLSHPKTLAIGETGLDYYWSTEDINLQKECLQYFLELGVEKNLPVILHDRDRKTPDNYPASTHDDIASMVGSVKGSRGIMHCFSGDADFALTMIELGYYISFAGNVTFKNAKDLQEAAIQVPLDKLLIETDSPFLSPMPFRGKPNEPARVKLVAEKIAELKGLSFEEVALQTTQNAKQVFGIK